MRNCSKFRAICSRETSFGADELEGPEWKDLAHRGMNTPMIREVAARQLADRTRADLYAAAEPLGMPLGMVQTPLEYVAHPQTVARAPFVDGIASSVGVHSIHCDI